MQKFKNKIFDVCNSLKLQETTFVKIPKIRFLQQSHQGAGFHSLTDGIDTNTSGGTLVFHIMGAMAQFERSLIVERTKAGMAAAKKRGKHIGRPPALSSGQIQHVHELLNHGETQGAVAERLGVSANTIGRAVRRQKRSCN